MFYKTWLKIALYRTKPAEIAQSTGLKKGLMHLILSYLITGAIAVLISSSTFNFLVEQFPKLTKGTVGLDSTLMSILTIPAWTFALGIIEMFAWVILLWLFAKLFGGKGSFRNYFGTLAMIEASVNGTVRLAISILSIMLMRDIPLTPTMASNPIAMIIAFIPMLFGTLLVVIAMPVYTLFLTVKATQAAHQVSIGRAVGTVALAGIVAIILLILLAFIITIIGWSLILAQVKNLPQATGTFSLNYIL